MRRNKNLRQLSFFESEHWLSIQDVMTGLDHFKFPKLRHNWNSIYALWLNCNEMLWLKCHYWKVACLKVQFVRQLREYIFVFLYVCFHIIYFHPFCLLYDGLPKIWCVSTILEKTSVHYRLFFVHSWHILSFPKKTVWGWKMFKSTQFSAQSCAKIINWDIEHSFLSNSLNSERCTKNRRKMF